MSYEDYIEEFWLKARTLKLDTTQIALGLALLHEWRGAGFPSRHSVPNEVLCDLLSCSKQTLVRARKRLIDGGLIVFEDGNARKQPVYVFGVAAVVPGAAEVVSELKPEPVAVVKPRPRKKVKVADGQPSLFSEQEMAPQKRVKREPEPPDFGEVVRVCMSKGMTEQEAREFYDYYNAQGWVTSSGQRIRNVDSMVNRWITIQRKRDESDRRLIQSRPSTADNIHDAQQQIIREMQQSVLGQAEGYSRGVPEELPGHL